MSPSPRLCSAQPGPQHQPGRQYRQPRYRCLTPSRAARSMRRMRIVIMGAGGLGGYFGARLAAAGNDVAFVARGEHLAAIRRDGLRVESARGDLHLRDVTATDDPSTLAPADVVMVAVKLWDTEAAA